jgi:hypothetical protein
MNLTSGTKHKNERHAFTGDFIEPGSSKSITEEDHK